MKNKKLKRLSLINVFTGYLMLVAFVLLVLLNRQEDATLIASEQAPVDHDPDGLFDGTHGEELYIDKRPLVIDRGVGVDRLSGVVIDDSPDVLVTGGQGVGHVAVVKNPDRVVVNEGNGVILGLDGRSETYIDREIIANRNTTIAGDDLSYERNTQNNLLPTVDGGSLHTLRGDGRGNRLVDSGVRQDDEDLGILDRRLKEIEEREGVVDIFALEEAIREKNEIEEEDLLNLSLAKDDSDPDFELDLDSFKEKDEGGGAEKSGGKLYAYNFPSQGVGAGIGSGAVGAGTGGSAGLGGGIGEAVLNGKTVPTLGGVGTYTSIQTVLPGTGTDRDKDGLSAETEIAIGTNPDQSDSDGDGYSDGAEISSYTNPINSESNPGVPGSTSLPTMGGVGGLVGGAGAGGAAGLTTGMVKKQLGVGIGPGKGCLEHGANCKGHHGRGHGIDREYDLPPDGALHIMIHVDGSGSLLSTRVKLEEMKETLLKDALLPYYNNDESLYNKRVTIISDSGERSLQFFTKASNKDNVLALAFQDEASPDYHLPNFNKKPQDAYSADLNKLKSGLNNYGGVYRGIMFQVDRGRTFSKSFKELIECAWNGEGYLAKENLKRFHRDNNGHNIRNKNGVVFSDEYHAKSEGDPKYYLDLIFNASKRVGIDLRSKGAGLTDGRHNPQ